MKKYILACALLSSSLLLGRASVAEAHFLSADGSVGAILHVDPDDDPIAGQTATFLFDIKDKQGKFQLADCDCKVVVQENGQELASQPLSQAGPSTASFSFVFPKKDVYKVQLIGSPLQPNGFQPFTINWDLRVDRQAGEAASGPGALAAFLAGHVIYLVLIGGALAAIAYWRIKGGKKGNG